MKVRFIYSWVRCPNLFLEFTNLVIVKGIVPYNFAVHHERRIFSDFPIVFLSFGLRIFYCRRCHVNRCLQTGRKRLTVCVRLFHRYSSGLGAAVTYVSFALARCVSGGIGPRLTAVLRSVALYEIHHIVYRVPFYREVQNSKVK